MELFHNFNTYTSHGSVLLQKIHQSKFTTLKCLLKSYFIYIYIYMVWVFHGFPYLVVSISITDSWYLQWSPAWWGQPYGSAGEADCDAEFTWEVTEDFCSVKPGILLRNNDQPTGELAKKHVTLGKCSVSSRYSPSPRAVARFRAVAQLEIRQIQTLRARIRQCCTQEIKLILSRMETMWNNIWKWKNMWYFSGHVLFVRAEMGAAVLGFWPDQLAECVGRHVWQTRSAIKLISRGPAVEARNFLRMKSAEIVMCFIHFYPLVLGLQRFVWQNHLVRDCFKGNHLVEPISHPQTNCSNNSQTDGRSFPPQSCSLQPKLSWPQKITWGEECARKKHQEAPSFIWTSYENRST